MGHHSFGLIREPQLAKLSGVILSPVNDTIETMRASLTPIPEHIQDIVFDPQLYFPRSERGKLPTWDYYPSDFETADIEAESWWTPVYESLLATCADLNATSLCSPAIVPRTFTHDYYDSMVRICNGLVTASDDVEVMQTIIVSLDGIADPRTVREVASIVSRTQSARVYLLLVTSVEPRRELHDTEGLKGAMLLISLLKRSGLEVTVGYTASDMVLWKHAGADVCATGKFFNLRRFTSSRWDEPSEGGQQLPYWFQDYLLGFLREPDVLRLRRNGSLPEAGYDNPFSARIIEQFDEQPGTPWLGLSWRQYLYEYSDLEGRISDGHVDVKRLVRTAESIWLGLEDNNVFMEEPRNNGSWLRPWLIALSEFEEQS